MEIEILGMEAFERLASVSEMTVIEIRDSLEEFVEGFGASLDLASELKDAEKNQRVVQRLVGGLMRESEAMDESTLGNIA